jgi:hypothetical protein
MWTGIKRPLRHSIQKIQKAPKIPPKGLFWHFVWEIKKATATSLLIAILAILAILASFLRNHFDNGINTLHTLLEKVFFLVRIQVQYPKSIKNLTFSSTNHDLFLKKEHFWFQKKNIFSTITVLDLNLLFFRVFVLRVYIYQ